MAGLELLGPCGWWAEGVRTALFTRPDGELSRVAALLGPEVADSGALARARKRAGGWLGRRDPGVVCLLAVEPMVGSTSRAGGPGPRRVAWIYEDVGGVSLSQLAQAEQPGHRLAAQLVAAVADVLEPLAAAGQMHPGLTPDDVLIGADGRVWVAGFVSPFARMPVHREPRGAEDSTAAVWRLGVLLAEMLTGAPPSPASDRSGHELMLRRLLIKVMSRPGPVFPERYRDWLTGMLAWDGDQRPPLSRVAPSLRELAAACAGAELPATAARWVPELRRRAESADAPVIEPSQEIVQTTNPPMWAPSERTEEADLPDPAHADDEKTAISIDNDPPARHVSLAPAEHGTIPVHVGPPPEAIPKATRLPEELFTQVSTETADGGSGLWWAPWAASAFLAVTAVILAWYLLH